MPLANRNMFDEIYQRLNLFLFSSILSISYEQCRSNVCDFYVHSIDDDTSLQSMNMGLSATPSQEDETQGDDEDVNEDCSRVSQEDETQGDDEDVNEDCSRRRG
jgi:hypothetical protein